MDESHPRPLSKADADASHLFVGLNRAEVEVLVVESERDEVIPHAVIETYLRKCPEARHAVLAGAAHGLTRPEWNAAFVSLIASWFAALSQHPARADRPSGHRWSGVHRQRTASLRCFSFPHALLTRAPVPTSLSVPPTWDLDTGAAAASSEEGIDVDDEDIVRTPASDVTLGRREFLTRLGGLAAIGALGLSGSESVTVPLGRRNAPRPGAADRDPLDLLKRMVSYDTQNFGRGGATRPFAEMLKSVWTRAGVAAEIIPTPQPNNVHLVARIKGTTSAAPVLMLGHSDVVPVERAKWDVDPFAGVVKDGQIFGRGALDMKGMNSATVSALLRHVAEGARFERDVIVLTDCDEEAGSYGATWLAKNHWNKVAAGMVLTEGGWFLAQKDQRTPMLISVTRQDKVYCNLDLTANGIATHSSKPNPDAAIVKLSRAVAELGDWLAPVHLTQVTRQYFAALAAGTRDRQLARAVTVMLAASSQEALERAARVVVARSSYPWLHSSLLRTTHAFVIENAGYKENVIPSSARVRVNCRAVPGGQKPRQFLTQVRRMMAGRGISVVLVTPAGTSETEHLRDLDRRWATPPARLDTPLYDALSRAAKKTYPGVVFTPTLFEAGTSLRAWRDRNIPGYGVYPYVISNEQLIAMHGTNERIYVDALRQGTQFMYEMFSHFRS